MSVFSVIGSTDCEYCYMEEKIGRNRSVWNEEDNIANIVPMENTHTVLNWPVQPGALVYLSIDCYVFEIKETTESNRYCVAQLCRLCEG